MLPVRGSGCASAITQETHGGERPPEVLHPGDAERVQRIVLNGERLNVPAVVDSKVLEGGQGAEERGEEAGLGGRVRGGGWGDIQDGAGGERIEENGSGLCDFEQSIGQTRGSLGKLL